MAIEGEFPKAFEDIFYASECNDFNTHGVGDGSDHEDVASNTSKRHTQNTDIVLGTGCVALDHGTASVDEIVNISYGTGSPPTANTTTEGSLFVQYIA